MKKITRICLYLPVIQRGYLRFLRAQLRAHEQHSSVEVVILAQDVLDEFAWLRKDIRSLAPDEAVTALRALLTQEDTHVRVQTINRVQLARASSGVKSDGEILWVMPDEDIMHALTEKYGLEKHATFIKVFLRWDKKSTLQELAVTPDTSITSTAFQKQMIARASALAECSADWWRQVAAVVIKDGHILLEAYNQHVPDQYQTLYQGDPRGNFTKGIAIELTTAMHAEAMVISTAARHGISLEGTEIFVTTFPCPNCAKLIAYSGITQLYFQDGYSLVDGESILKEKGVNITQVGYSQS